MDFHGPDPSPVAGLGGSAGAAGIEVATVGQAGGVVLVLLVVVLEEEVIRLVVLLVVRVVVGANVVGARLLVVDVGTTQSHPIFSL